MIKVFSDRPDKPQAYGFHAPGDIGDGKSNLPYDPIEFAISSDGQNWHSAYDEPNLAGIYCFQAPDVQPANPNDSLQKVGITDGQRLLATSYDTRDLKMSVCYYDAKDNNDALLGYDALQRFLVTRAPFWICFSSWPQRMYYVRAKLALPSYTGSNWSSDVTLTDLVGLSRSVGSTGNWSEHIAGFGNQEFSKETSYSFSSNNFSVWNFSDVRIDPERRGHPLKITIKGSSVGNLKITNTTTGEAFTYKKPISNSTLVIDGVNPTLDGKGCLMDSDYGIITLQIGQNNFTLENFSGTVTFDFPMWWLS